MGLYIKGYTGGDTDIAYENILNLICIFPFLVGPHE